MNINPSNSFRDIEHDKLEKQNKNLKIKKEVEIEPTTIELEEIKKEEFFLSPLEKNLHLKSIEEDIHQMEIFSEFILDPEFNTIVEQAAQAIDNLVETAALQKNEDQSLKSSGEMGSEPESSSINLMESSSSSSINLEDLPTSNTMEQESLKGIFSPELFPSLEKSLELAGNFSLVMTLVNAASGAKEIIKIRNEINEAKLQLEELKIQFQEGGNTSEIQRDIENLENKILNLEEEYEDAHKKAVLTLLENGVLASGRDLSRVSQLLTIVGAGSKIALAGGAVGLVGGGLHVVLSTVDLARQTKQRTAIEEEKDRLINASKDNNHPAVETIMQYRLDSLSEQYDQSSIDTVQSSLWFTCSSVSGVSSVGAALLALGVTLPPVGVGLVTIGGATGLVMLGGLLIAGAGRAAYKNREVIQTSGKRISQWQQKRKLEALQTNEAKKFEEINKNIEDFNLRLDELSKRTQKEIEVIDDEISKILHEMQELDAKGTPFNPDESLSIISEKTKIIAAKIKANEEKIASLFTTISENKGNPKILRDQLHNLSAEQFILKQKQSSLKDAYALQKANLDLNTLKNERKIRYTFIDNEIQKHNQIISKINQSSKQISKLSIDKENITQSQAELKQRITDITRSQQLGVTLEVYLDYKNEINELLTDEKAKEAIYDFLRNQSIDLSDFKTNPIDLIMNYITRKVKDEKQKS